MTIIFGGAKALNVIILVVYIYNVMLWYYEYCHICIGKQPNLKSYSLGVYENPLVNILRISNTRGSSAEFFEFR